MLWIGFVVLMVVMAAPWVLTSAVRTCTRYGWAGRMRWRLAPERVSDRR
ncbi:MAG TPA: hypothetical protein VGO40_18225 [Longimicrobium sp.]|jgi:hypothetical protein|nr:hypothetical protein [Longimicrobium sp.]